MKIHFEDLSPEQFERLVVAICQFVLGAGTQGFAPGQRLNCVPPASIWSFEAAVAPVWMGQVSA